MQNCFYCDGKTPPKECIENRMYHQNEMEECCYYQAARNDLIKLQARQLNGITLGNMLAEYLSDKGEIEKALAIISP